MNQHVADLNLPDLTGVSIYLCTPSMEGKYVREYVRSLDRTKEVVRAAGGTLDWGEMPYCADVSMARNFLIGAFYKRGFTHMLTVDDDMGWDPYDVLRLVETNLDVVGGAGPKKQYPIRFCMDATDDQGRCLAGEYNSGALGALEVSAVGTGFLMIKRNVVEKMIAAYPELAFSPEPPGTVTVEYGLFDSFIVNMRRKTDDYAFCHRWRAIGGKVYILPSINLKHIGPHTFQGSVLDAMMAEFTPEPASA